MHALFCIVDYLRTRYDTVQYSIFEGTKVLSKVQLFMCTCTYNSTLLLVFYYYYMYV